MAKTPSTMLALGTIAPDFSLLDTISGELFTLHKHNTAKAIVILFICNHCPYVKHIQHMLPILANDYIDKGILFIAINSNDVNQYPDDSPMHMQQIANAVHYPFPYLYD